MKNNWRIPLAVWLVTIVLASLTQAQESSSGGAKPAAIEPPFVGLLSGDSLSGWHGDNPHETVKADNDGRAAAIEKQQDEFKAHWRVVAGELINDGHGPYATTDQEYGDVEFLVDYRTVPLADSGIYLRGNPQVQIWDTTEAGGKWNLRADLGSGGLYNNRDGSRGRLPLVYADKPFGQWNHFSIIQIGSRTWVELNHKLVVDGAIMDNYFAKGHPLPATGPIHLQTHGGEIRWRNLAIREVDEVEAISRLRGDDAKYGFTSIFNGQDLTGWQGATDNYEVRDGAIVCKPEKGGVLFTDEQYDDFMVRLEFKLPPGGNNGLAIRYPGSGDTAYVGMCELQVLDDTAARYAKLDPRQAHGSAYGLAAAHRGYLRPVGQWNYQQVTVKGSKITVELNCNIILDTDVSQISETLENRAHPGVGLKSGYFGFAGHGDPVMFRNIAIKRLNPPASASSADLRQAMVDAMIFHASFDGGTTADVHSPSGSGALLTAPSIDSLTDNSIERAELKRGKTPAALSIAAGAGRYGDALRFAAKTPEVVFYEGSEFGYQPQDWSGSLSVWLKLDPNKDLEPGYCDPLQITQRGWNDAAFFVDFDKFLPRDFRLGVFADSKAWNPQQTSWDDLPVSDRPMIVVKQPPFSKDEWTQVCFTWKNVNSADGSPAHADFYLNGKFQGAYQSPSKFTWDPQQAAIMLGINYIGLMDDLTIFKTSLNAEQVELLYQHPVGGLK